MGFDRAQRRLAGYRQQRIEEVLEREAGGLWNGYPVQHVDQAPAKHHCVRTLEQPWTEPFSPILSLDIASRRRAISRARAPRNTYDRQKTDRNLTDYTYASSLCRTPSCLGQPTLFNTLPRISSPT